MILLDSNIVIYLHDNKLSQKAIEMINNTTVSTCNVIIAEVLGFAQISHSYENAYREMLNNMKNYLFDKEVTEKVVEIRKNSNLKLPDAIIAATAIVNDLVLWTHNTKDFKKVPGLKLYDPLQD